MIAYQFFRVLAVDAVDVVISRVVKQQVIAHTTADEAFLDAGKGIHGAINVEQPAVVGIEVAAYLRMDAGGPFAPVTDGKVLAMHAIHVGAGTAQVAEITLETGHVDDFPHLVQNAAFAACGDKFPLMG
jgi:hypothetical protein